MANGKRRTKPGELGEAPETRLENVPAAPTSRPRQADAVGEGAAEELVEGMEDRDIRRLDNETRKDNIRAEAEPVRRPPAVPASESKPGRRHSSREIESIRDGLIERKRRLAATMGKLSGESIQNTPRDLGEISSLPQHLADLGSETFEQDKDIGLAERASVEITEIDQALERLKAGTYGICEGCDAAIPEDRLNALPYASLCAACKGKQEAA